MSSNEGSNRGLKSRAVCDAIAGAVSGCVSRFAVGPLDVLKIRFQVQIEPISAHYKKGPVKYTGVVQALKTIVKEEGITALWRGTVPGQLLTIPYTSVQFITLQGCKSLLKKIDRGGISSAWVSFVSGGVAGAAATISSYPFDLLRTTLAAQGSPKVYKGMVDAAKKIYAARGVAGLYSGLQITLLEIIPYSAITFASYDLFHQLFDKAKNLADVSPERQVWQNFLCGFAAGLVGKLATHPLDVVKKRYQVAGLQRSLAYGKRVDVKSVSTLMIACRSVVKNEGLLALWKGSIPNLLKAGPASAVTLVTYEFFVSLLLESNLFNDQASTT